LEDTPKEETTTSQEIQTNFASSEETQGEVETMKAYASSERNLSPSNEVGENTAAGKKVEWLWTWGE
jgi:hypothetical protein